MNKIDKIIKYFRSLNEESPTMSLGAGKIAGTKQAGDDPPVDLRTKLGKKIPYFYRKYKKKL